LDPIARALFFRTIDENGSGFIEYSEFAMLMCKLAKRKHAEGTLGKLQMTGLIHELAASGTISVNRVILGPLHRGTSGLGLKLGDNDDEDSENNQDDTMNSMDDTDDKTSPNKSGGGGGCGRFFCCFHSSKIAAMKEQMYLSMQKPVGPHGRYCLCGCRNLE
jgi:hypothetical protein